MEASGIYVSEVDEVNQSRCKPAMIITANPAIVIRE